MDTELTPALTERADLAQLVQAKSPLVEREIGVSATHATWDLVIDDRGRPRLQFRVRDDFDGQGSTQFAPEELRLEDHLRSRLHELKGAVLRVAGWRRRLRDLYEKIREWSKSHPQELYIEEGVVTLREERSGEYEAPCLTLRGGGQSMRFEPVGRWVVGADGRVDAKGIGGPFVLFLLESENAWFVLEDALGAVSTTLNRESLLRVVETCLNG